MVYFAFDVVGAIGQDVVAFDALMQAVLKEVAQNVGIPQHRLDVVRFDVASRQLTLAVMPAHALAPAEAAPNLRPSEPPLAHAAAKDVVTAFLQLVSDGSGPPPPGSWMVRMSNATVTQEAIDMRTPSSSDFEPLPFVVAALAVVVVVSGLALAWCLLRPTPRAPPAGRDGGWPDERPNAHQHVPAKGAAVLYTL